MVENWITAEIVRNSVRGHGIYLTAKDAETILSKLDQQSAYAKHAPRIVFEIWKGGPINGIDVSKHPNEDTRKTAFKFLTDDTGLAYKVIIDGKLTGFQPHVPGIQGYHALTSKTVQCHKGHMHETCATCGQEHDIEKIIAERRDEIIKGFADRELLTHVLYLAQEIYDRRMETLDKLSAMC